MSAEKKTIIPEDIAIAVKAASDKKAENIVVLDVEKISNITSHFIFLSGTNKVQNRSIASEIYDKLAEQKIKPLHKEGSDSSGWILMDYGNFIIHIFLEDVRHFYDLEGLWGDAPSLDVKHLID